MARAGCSLWQWFAPSASTLIASMLLGSLLLGCKAKESVPTEASVAPDRLRPDEVMVGTEVVFGMAMPRELKVQSRFVKAVHLLGKVPAPELISYFRGLVIV